MFSIIIQLVHQDTIKCVQSTCAIPFDYKQESESTASMSFENREDYSRFIQWISAECRVYGDVEKNKTDEALLDYLMVFHAVAVPHKMVE